MLRYLNSINMEREYNPEFGYNAAITSHMHVKSPYRARQLLHHFVYLL
ncbi:MAG: hypothetical protein NZ901_04905 [Geminocystis sp.]|nr:hypothetical protein [Geminocystis sp.]HIK37118.1 hypothetical protein [Geminocystis sp. M7585_C2015_104]MCS7147513.1 hypothetical protein [Geminocystis sp.]MCX8077916.1 hypothetical protein [Geminocystis sp.]MDW8115206.1 hypothetical protein [Geminocystis sp.]